MLFTVAVLKCSNSDTRFNCPMHTVFKDMVKRGLFGASIDKAALSPAQRKRLTIACINCEYSGILMTEPGYRKAQRGFRPVGETIDEYIARTPNRSD